MSFIEQLQADREVDVKFWKKHPELRKQLVDDAYPDEAHFIYELLQNAEDAEATSVTFELTQSQLVLRHDGKRLFLERDVEAITDVSKSAKESNSETIGKFGIGFKSVFKYTDSPRIYSGDFNFEIIDFVYPQIVARVAGQEAQTVFVFPFNNPRKSAVDAFEEVKAGLAGISATTLLYLSCVKSIDWKVGNQSGAVFREEHSDGHIEVLKEVENNRTESSHWLRFTAPVKGLRKQYVAIAFELAFLGDRSEFKSKFPLSKQFRIVPSARGTVSVFFPAEKEASGLRFHLHAPFLPELSRASVKNTPANKPLFTQLAELTARSLHELKGLGLLTGEFLAVLPNSEDVLPENYRVIREAVINEMRSEPLVPTYRKGFAPAKMLLQARAALKDLLSDEDLAFLHERNDGITWAIGATQRNGLQDKFLSSLSINSWDSAELAELISERAPEIVYSWDEPEHALFMKWLGAKSDEWHQQLYALLHRTLTDSYEYYLVQSAKIIRLGDGTYSVGKKVYFPTVATDKADPFPRVAAAILGGGSKKNQQDDAREFLRRAGVREVGESELIGLIVKARYSKGVPQPADDIYLADLKRFIAHLEMNPMDRQQFANAYLFKLDTGKWGMPSQVYIDRPYKETGLRFYHEAVANRSRWALSAWYQQCGIDLAKITRFAQTVGCSTSFSEFVIQTNCNKNPKNTYLWGVAGSRRTSPIDRDYTTSQVIYSLLETQNADFSRLVWRTMCELPTQKLWAVYQKNETAGAHRAPSVLVYLMKDAEWVPVRDGRFVKPCDASRDGLLDGFTFDAAFEWLEMVDFGVNELKKSIEYSERTKKRTELGFNTDEELARAQAFVKLLPLEEQDRILQEYARRSEASAGEFPMRPVRNKELRGQRVRDQAASTPEKESELRSRAVAIGFEAAKAEAKQYLQDQYTNENDVMFCQICKGPLPFRLSSGQYYFEAVEATSGANKRFREAFLALCPNHAAMFQYANDDRDNMQKLLERAAGHGELEVNITLAGEAASILFTETHLTDIRACIEALSLEQAGI